MKEKNPCEKIVPVAKLF